MIATPPGPSQLGKDALRMADSSFDVVSNVDRQEVDNALNQAKKELAQRFDFKNTGTSIEWSGDGVTIASKTDKRAEAALDVFKDKLVRRKVSLKALESGQPKPAGGGFSATTRIVRRVWVWKVCLASRSMRRSCSVCRMVPPCVICAVTTTSAECE